ncbi:MAG: tetratricopeptide repeat protein [Candidatus Heimdallarchaeota archaeon]|nr:tetratricopeptide repeat protein [Candidatus Heimdallarchaeota archaeon]
MVVPINVYNSIASSKFEEALVDLESLSDDDYLEGIILQAEILKSQGKFGDSLDLLESIEDQLKQNGDQRLILANICIKLYNYESMKEFFEIDILVEEGEKTIKNLLVRILNVTDPVCKQTMFIWIGMYYNIVGNARLKKGRLKTALDYYSKAIDYRKRVENKIYVASTLNNIAIIYLLMGEYVTAKSYFANGLDLAQEYNAGILGAVITQNIGIVSYFTGETENALSFLHQSLEYLLEETEYSSYLSMNYLYLILTFIDFKRNEEANIYFERLRDLANEHPYRDVLLHEKLANAMILKSKERFIHQAQSLSILKEIVNEEIIDITLTRLAMVNLCDILLTEYKLFGNEEAYTELYQIVGTLYQLSQKSESVSLMIDVLIFRSRFALIQGDFDEVDKLLIEAENLAVINGIPKLRSKVKEVKETFSNEISRVEMHLDSDDAEVHRKRKSDLLNYLSDLGRVVS